MDYRCQSRHGRMIVALGVAVVGVVAFTANVKAGPRGGDGVTPVSAEVVSRVRLPDGVKVYDIPEDAGSIPTIRAVGQQGRIASGGSLTPIWDAPIRAAIAGPWHTQPNCPSAVDQFSATTGLGDQWLFGNGVGATGAGGAIVAEYSVVWCAGFSPHFEGPDVCNTIQGDDTSCPLFGQSVCGDGTEICICVDCYDGVTPYEVRTGVYTGDPCTGSEVLIAGTHATYASSHSKWGPNSPVPGPGDGVGCVRGVYDLPVKTYIPDGAWLELEIDLEDYWARLAYGPTVGIERGGHLDWNIDADSDGCNDAYSCFSGTAWPEDDTGWALPSTVRAAAAYTLSLLPVSVDEIPANGGDTSGVSGNTIRVPVGGHRLVLEFWWSDWSNGPAGDIAVTAFEAFLDSSGFTSGLRGAITYSDIDCGWADPPPCWGGATCCPASGFIGAEKNKCVQGYIADTRSDFIFSTLPYCVGGDNDGKFCFGGFGCTGGGTCKPASIVTIIDDLSTMDLHFGVWLHSQAITSPGRPTYAATILTEISEDALGTFTIWPHITPYVGLLGANGTAWQGKNLPLLGVIPAVVEIVGTIPCCLPDFTCSLAMPDECAGVVVSECEGDADGHGRDDACELIMFPGAPIPTVSAWGMVVMALLLLTTRMVISRRASVSRPHR